MKKTIIILLVLMSSAALLYAGSGDLIVTDKIGVGPTISPAYPVDVQGDVNVTGNFRINGVVQPAALTGAISGLAIANNSSSPNNEIDVKANYIVSIRKALIT